MPACRACLCSSPQNARNIRNLNVYVKYIIDFVNKEVQSFNNVIYSSFKNANNRIKRIFQVVSNFAKMILVKQISDKIAQTVRDFLKRTFDTACFVAPNAADCFLDITCNIGNSLPGF